MPSVGRLLFVALALPGLVAGCAQAERRPAGTSFEDEAIESRAISELKTQRNATVHVNVTAFNHHVLLTGEVPTEASKAEIEKIVSGVPNVTGISNELGVGEVLGLGARGADTLITSQVKLRLMNKSNFDTGRVKIVTENGTVYMMGLLYHSEGAAAADVASTTKGVQRVITMFEYLD